MVPATCQPKRATSRQPFGHACRSGISFSADRDNRVFLGCSVLQHIGRVLHTWALLTFNVPAKPHGRRAQLTQEKCVKPKEETKKVRVRNSEPTPPLVDDDEQQWERDFADSGGLTGQGAQSALDHLMEQERTRFDRPKG
jgi:hypothetical protein